MANIILWLAYTALSIVQFIASIRGIEHISHLPEWACTLLALVVAGVPVVGTAFSAIGAHYAWGWSWLASIIIFAGPLLLIFSGLAFEQFSAKLRARKVHISTTAGGPEGVGGWLSFLVILLQYLIPVLTVLVTYADFSSAEVRHPDLARSNVWVAFKSAEWIAISLAMVLSHFAGRRLAKVSERSSVTFAILSIWAIGPLLSFVMYLLIPSIFIPSGATNQGTSQVAGAILWAAIWTSYLVFSRRVKNTYRHNGTATFLENTHR